MAQARRAALSWKQQPPQDRLTDRVLEPALSQKLNRGTNGQAWEAALSRPQMSSPGQDLRRSPPLLHEGWKQGTSFLLSWWESKGKGVLRTPLCRAGLTRTVHAPKSA